ncbi:MAG: type II toxin-antitoxin system RelE/ParE family toxin [Tannerellaceae bacterium]|nr:type II toxin-antitoxin system RelE/ParE family toxin [Tannerellaceae bacterium]
MILLWSPLAIKNIEDIYDYYATISKQLATKIYNNILDEAKRLEIFPEMAAPEPYLSFHDKNFRSLITKGGKYKITYYIHGERYIIISSVTSCLQSPDILISKFR